MAAAKRRRRLTYREPGEKQVREAWRAALLFQPACMDYLEQVCLDQSFVANDPYLTAFNEGRRSMAGQLLQFSIDQPETKVQKNVEDE